MNEMKIDYSYLSMVASSAGLLALLLFMKETNPLIWASIITLDIIIWMTYFAQKERKN
jgi:hypothetical protein